MKTVGNIYFIHIVLFLAHWANGFLCNISIYSLSCSTVYWQEFFLKQKKKNPKTGKTIYRFNTVRSESMLPSNWHHRHPLREGRELFFSLHWHTVNMWFWGRCFVTIWSVVGGVGCALPPGTVRWEAWGDTGAFRMLGTDKDGRMEQKRT